MLVKRENGAGEMSHHVKVPSPFVTKQREEWKMLTSILVIQRYTKEPGGIKVAISLT